jgi:hypothetical protein
MQRSHTLPIVLAVASAVLALLLGFLINVVSSFYIDALRPYAGWIFAGLGLIFAASIGVLIWQIVLDRRSTAAGAGHAVSQTATRHSEIVDSGIEVAGADSVDIQQKADQDSSIKNSPINIS